MDSIIKKIQQHSKPLESEKDLDMLMERIGDAKIVMLGEASHGTKEYYLWRSVISQRLIKEKNFSCIAVEGDWPDCYEVNRYVKGYRNSSEDAEQVLRIFKRWPSWMWANEDIRELVNWLHEYNTNTPPDRMIGFYGLDVYSLWESMEAIIAYLKDTNNKSLGKAYRAYGCFEPYSKEAYNYGSAAAFVEASCQEEVVELLSDLRTKIKKYEDSEEALLNAEQNARVTQNAEKYYRTLVGADDLSWNVRDRHMMETLDRLLEYHDPNAKIIVWAHNTHIGDARATPMGDSGMINIGQLARLKHGKANVVLIGFGSYEGSVIAGASWGAPMEKMSVPKAQQESWEYIFHEAGAKDALIITDDLKDTEGMQKRRGHRAIGVVYDSGSESGNYVPTDLIDRYDAFIYCDQTRALDPLPVGYIEMSEVPETFPTGE